MTRVLLTGGSGFIAAHCLSTLLERGHSVVTTVRSIEKANKIREAHANVPKERLDFAIVEDIAKPGAFDNAIKSDPPFEAVIHTASPFHFKADDIKRDLLDPAIIGTTGILKAIKANAPTVKRVVITSSFAAIIDGSKGLWPGHTYTEKDWSPLDEKTSLENQSNGYRGSKTLAEKAAWAFVEKEKPNFDLATMNPPLVLGPIVHYLNSLDALNTSNEKIRDYMKGSLKGASEIPSANVVLWVDVRDLALAHVLAMEKPEAGGKRFFVTKGYHTNRELVDIIRKHFPEYKDVLPDPNVPGGDLPKEIYSFDNSRTTDVLGLKMRDLEGSIVDLVKSLKAVGA